MPQKDKDLLFKCRSTCVVTTTRSPLCHCVHEWCDTAFEISNNIAVKWTIINTLACLLSGKLDPVQYISSECVLYDIATFLCKLGSQIIHNN